MQKTKRYTVLAIAISLIASTALISMAEALITPGVLKCEGSSTVLPISLAAETSFETWLNATQGIECDVQIAGGGSGAGYSRLIAAEIDVGAHSREPKSSEWAAMPDMRIWAIGMDSLAIIVHNATGDYPGCTITNVTPQQVSDIFCGVYNYWDEVIPGAPHQAIKRAIRVLDSGTHDCFYTFFLQPFGRTNTNLAPDCEQYENNIDIYNLLVSPAGQWYIAYIGLGFVDLGDIKPLWLWNAGLGEYVKPSRENALLGTYPPIRWLWYSTNGIPTDIEIKLWISYIKANPSYVSDEGYIVMHRGDFTSGNPSPDATAPIHPNLPDNRVDYYDIIYFADAYISQLLDPYADIDGDCDIDYDDIIAFIESYITYWSGPH